MRERYWRNWYKVEDEQKVKLHLTYIKKAFIKIYSP